jgi:hypothetical protein
MKHPKKWLAAVLFSFMWPLAAMAADGESGRFWQAIEAIEKKEPDVTGSDVSSIARASAGTPVIQYCESKSSGELILVVPDAVTIPLADVRTHFGVPQRVVKSPMNHPPTMVTGYIYKRPWGEIEFRSFLSDRVNLVICKTGKELANEIAKRLTVEQEWEKIDALMKAGAAEKHYISYADISTKDVEKHLGKPTEIEHPEQSPAWGQHTVYVYKRPAGDVFFDFCCDESHLDNVTFEQRK